MHPLALDSAKELIVKYFKKKYLQLFEKNEF